MNHLQTKAAELHAALVATKHKNGLGKYATTENIVSDLMDLGLEATREYSGDVLAGMSSEQQHQVVDVLLDMLVPNGGIEISSVGTTSWIKGAMHISGPGTRPSWRIETARRLRVDRITQIVPECIREQGDPEAWLFSLCVIADGHRYFVSPNLLRRPALDAAIIRIQEAIDRATGPTIRGPNLIRVFGGRFIDANLVRKVDRTVNFDDGHRFTSTYVFGRDEKDVLLAAETDIVLGNPGDVQRDNFVHAEIVAAIREGRNARDWDASVHAKQ